MLATVCGNRAPRPASFSQMIGLSRMSVVSPLAGIGCMRSQHSATMRCKSSSPSRRPATPWSFVAASTNRVAAAMSFPVPVSASVVTRSTLGQSAFQWEVVSSPGTGSRRCVSSSMRTTSGSGSPAGFVAGDGLQESIEIENRGGCHAHTSFGLLFGHRDRDHAADHQRRIELRIGREEKSADRVLHLFIARRLVRVAAADH